MLITSYNEAAWGDTLIAILGPDSSAQTTRTGKDVVGIYAEDGTAIGFNFFHVGDHGVNLAGNGQVVLDDAQIAALNAMIEAAGLPGALTADPTPKFVIGKVIALDDHPDSDHLHVAQVDFGDHQEQIVCGAPNAALGQTVVAALPGAMMPDGKIIWPGSLRGVASAGMLASARELGLPNAPTARGILIMPDDIPAGTPFDFEAGAAVVAAQNAEV